MHVSWLFDVAGVSKSGYYKWLACKDNRDKRELEDQKDFELILNAYKFRGYNKGARSIQMRLLHQGITMNLKKIRRLMKKYNLVCPIRKPNPYRLMLRAQHEDKVVPNTLNRQFKMFAPRRAILTDITYLFYGKGQRCYLSVMKDTCTNEVLSYAMSENMMEDFVLETVQNLLNNHGDEIDEKTIIHSDQGAHYTAKQFSEVLRMASIRQSMSRRANCWDNAPQESFFGHMKDEIGEKLNECKTYKEVSALISDWMDYYNNDRYQWELAKLSPVEFYKYYMTGRYPLESSGGNEDWNG